MTRFQQSNNKNQAPRCPSQVCQLATYLCCSPPLPLLRVSPPFPFVKGISCYRNGGCWQLGGKFGNCKMDQLPEKAPAQEAMDAPGCQELAVLPTDPGPLLQRDFETMRQNYSAQLGGATKLRTNQLSELKLRDPAVVRHTCHRCVYSPNHLLFLSVCLDSSFTIFRAKLLSLMLVQGSPLLKIYYICGQCVSWK